MCYLIPISLVAVFWQKITSNILYFCFIETISFIKLKTKRTPSGSNSSSEEVETVKYPEKKHMYSTFGNQQRKDVQIPEKIVNFIFHIA